MGTEQSKVKAAGVSRENLRPIAYCIQCGGNIYEWDIHVVMRGESFCGACATCKRCGKHVTENTAVWPKDSDEPLCESCANYLDAKFHDDGKDAEESHLEEARDRELSNG